MDTVTSPSRRERARAATMEEIKQTALELMRDQGHTDVRFSDIARAMGLTPPALYRYYADRDELLTELITDAYRDLAAALVAPVHPQESPDAQESLDPQAHLLLVASAYRAWARGEPHKFALIFGPPVPGYAAPEEGPTVEAAQGAMANLASVVHRAAAQGAVGDPIIADVDPDTWSSLTSEEKSGSVGGDLPVATHQAMLHAWAAVHGFVCLEAYGHFDWFPVEARDGLFRTQVRLAGLAIGLRDA